MYKKRIIDEKLARLGIDEVFGGGTGVPSTHPHIHAPHARAASVRILPQDSFRVISDTY